MKASPRATNEGNLPVNLLPAKNLKITSDHRLSYWHCMAYIEFSDFDTSGIVPVNSLNCARLTKRSGSHGFSFVLTSQTLG